MYRLVKFLSVSHHSSSLPLLCLSHDSLTSSSLLLLLLRHPLSSLRLKSPPLTLVPFSLSTISSLSLSSRLPASLPTNGKTFLLFRLKSNIVLPTRKQQINRRRGPSCVFMCFCCNWFPCCLRPTSRISLEKCLEMFSV